MDKSPGSHEPQKAVDLAAKVFALTATLCFLLSIVYDWGYFHALGLDFSQVPTSMTDHVRSALVWIPETLVILGALAVAELFFRRVEGGMSEEELIATASNPEFIRRLRRSPFVLFVVIAVAGGVLWVLLGDRFRGVLAMTAIMFWALFISWVLSHPRLASAAPPILRDALIWIPLGGIIVYSFGYADARFSLQANREPVKVFLKSASNVSPVDYHLVRHFESFLLAKDKSGGIVLVRSQEISRIDDFAKPPMFRGILCSQFGVACYQPPPKAPATGQKSFHGGVQPMRTSGRG